MRRWCSALALAPRRLPGGLWRLLGSRQCLHGCTGLGLACLVIMAYELGALSQALGSIAQAQAISAYAVLRQLQTPGPGPLASTNAGPSATRAIPAGIAAIDPQLLGAVDGVRAPPARTSRGAPQEP